LAGGPVRNITFSADDDYGHFSANMLGQIGYETGNGFMLFAQYTPAWPAPIMLRAAPRSATGPMVSPLENS